MSENVFEVIDKTGRKIIMPKKQWSHLMRKHSYMIKYEEEIKATIQNPDKLIRIKTDKAYYYKNYKYLKKPNRFVFVVVKYLNNHGFVITSYLTGDIE